MVDVTEIVHLRLVLVEIVEHWARPLLPATDDIIGERSKGRGDMGTQHIDRTERGEFRRHLIVTDLTRCSQGNRAPTGEPEDDAVDLDALPVNELRRRGKPLSEQIGAVDVPIGDVCLAAVECGANLTICLIDELVVPPTKLGLAANGVFSPQC